jgi:hypothetical protein
MRGRVQKRAGRKLSVWTTSDRFLARRSSLTKITHLAVVLLVAACTTPYDPPVVEEPGIVSVSGQVPPFQGISALINPNSTPRVLWTHGMCSHDERWVENRATLVAAALSGQITRRTGTVSKDNAYVVPVSITTPNGKVDIAFAVWSPLTTRYKTLLIADNPDVPNPSNSYPVGQNPYRRASLNRDLKVSLMNDCLVDAVVYSGTNGSPIRDFMLGTVCATLGGYLDSTGCNLSRADSQPIVFVTESLGSKFLFDSVRQIWNEHRWRFVEAQQKLAERIASIQIIFMAANQIPLLDQANPPLLTALPSTTNGLHAPSISAFLTILGDSRRRAVPQMGKSTIVAFSDPNDLLSYRLLLADLETSDVRLINIIVSNDDTLGGYVERPDSAHCGYAWNAYVVGMIVNGYDAARPFPKIAGGGSSSCLGP